jgi:hypothetical protein
MVHNVYVLGKLCFLAVRPQRHGSPIVTHRREFTKQLAQRQRFSRHRPTCLVLGIHSGHRCRRLLAHNTSLPKHTTTQPDTLCRGSPDVGAPSKIGITPDLHWDTPLAVGDTSLCRAPNTPDHIQHCSKVCLGRSQVVRRKHTHRRSNVRWHALCHVQQFQTTTTRCWASCHPECDRVSVRAACRSACAAGDIGVPRRLPSTPNAAASACALAHCRNVICRRRGSIQSRCQARPEALRVNGSLKGRRGELAWQPSHLCAPHPCRHRRIT